MPADPAGRTRGRPMTISQLSGFVVIVGALGLFLWTSQRL